MFLLLFIVVVFCLQCHGNSLHPRLRFGADTGSNNGRCECSFVARMNINLSESAGRLSVVTKVQVKCVLTGLTVCFIVM
jgi:hypothetical protein